MTINTPSAAFTKATSASASVVTASFTPPANSELLIFGVGGRSTAAATKPTISNTGGLVFTELGSVANGAFGGYNHSIVWRASVGASPSAMTVTVSSTSASRTTVHGYTFPKSEVSPATWPATTASRNGSGNLTVTPGTFGTDQAGLAFFGSNNESNDISDDSGYTEIIESSDGSFTRTRITFDNSSPDDSWIASGQNFALCVIAMRVLPLVVYTFDMSSAAYEAAASAITMFRRVTFSLATAEYRATAGELNMLRGLRYDLGSINYEVVGMGVNVLRSYRFDAGSVSYEINSGDLGILWDRVYTLDSADYEWIGGEMTITEIDPGETVLLLSAADYEFVPGEITVEVHRVFSLLVADYEIVSNSSFLYNRRFGMMQPAAYNVAGGELDIYRTRYMSLGSAAYDVAGGEANTIFYLIWVLDSADYHVVAGDTEDDLYVPNRWIDTHPVQPIWQDTGIYG